MKAVILGDFSPTAENYDMFRDGDVETLFSDSLSIYEGMDVKLVNLECALTESENRIKKFGPNLKAHPNTAKTLKKIGVDYCSLANNHFFDFGKEGVRDSLAALDEAGIKYTGFGDDYNDSRKDLIIEKDGEKLCIIAVCEHEYSYALEDRMGCRPYDEYETMIDIIEAKKKADRVVVIYHGGKEHCRYPSPRLRKLCRAMAYHGADMVLCQHSHCIGCYEEYLGCHILYGQGNYHFEKQAYYSNPSWNGSLAVSYDTKTDEISFTPLVSNEKGGIRLANAEERARMLTGFEERNRSLEDGSWEKGFADFCETVREKYEKVLRNAYTPEATEKENHLFAHYLDCEAHTDVWRQLNKTANNTNEK